MKHLFVIGLIGGISICAHQSITHDTIDSTTNDTVRINKKGPFVENDTVFLYRYASNTDGDYNFKDFYIETNRQSKSYQKVLEKVAAVSNNVTEWNIDHVNAQLKQIKEFHPAPLTKHPIPKQMQEGWMPLHSFQGKYYINDLDVFHMFWITDSLYIRNYMDGPTYYIIQSFKEISPGHYQFSKAYRNSVDNIDIYMIDEKRKIAVFVKSSPGENYSNKGLFVAQETADLFDLIACRSRDMPINEVEYDEIDFDALLKPFKENKK